MESSEYISSNIWGPAGGEGGLEKPQAMKNGLSLYFSRAAMVSWTFLYSASSWPSSGTTIVRSEYWPRLRPARLRFAGRVEARWGGGFAGAVGFLSIDAAAVGAFVPGFGVVDSAVEDFSGAEGTVAILFEELGEADPVGVDVAEGGAVAEHAGVGGVVARQH